MLRKSLKPLVQQGFTLIELMVTVAVLAVLLSIAVPNFTSQIQAGRAEMAADGLKRAVANARALAAQTGKRTVITINGSVTGCGTLAAWAITQGSSVVGCLTSTDFSKRYEGARIDSEAASSLMFAPSGLGVQLENAAGSQSTVTYVFVSGNKRKQVRVDVGGSVEVTDV